MALRNCSDREMALKRWLARDIGLSRWIRRDAIRHGVTWLSVDGSHSAETLADKVAAYFAAGLA